MKHFLIFLTWLIAGYTQPQVTTTLAPYAYAIEKIGGDKIAVSILIPENANPHIYESKPQDLQLLSKSSLWFCCGEALEKKLASTVQARKVDLNVNITKHKQDHCHCHHHDHDHNYDLHTWLSPKNYLIQAKVILSALNETFPENKAFFEANFLSLEKELVLLDQQISGLKLLGKKPLIVAHAAYTYLCHDLNIAQLSLEEDGKEASIKHIQHVFKTTQNTSPKTIFAQVQHGDLGAKRLAQLLKANVVYVNPYQKNYPQAIKEILDNLE